MSRFKFLLLLATMLAAASLNATTTFTVSHTNQVFSYLCTEDFVAGCVMALPVNGTAISVASDGEFSFDPWGASFDTSDQISLGAGWLPDVRYVGMQGNFWQACPQCGGAPNPINWVYPGTNAICGNENEPTCEPIGAWFFPGAQWSGNLPVTFIILDENGVSISDAITLGNFGPGGTAGILFNSQVPEPASLLLLGSGLLGAAGFARRRFLS